MQRVTALVVRTHPASELLTFAEVAARCGLHPTVVEHFATLGLIDYAEGHRDCFPPEVTLRVQRIIRLRQDLGIPYNAAGLVLDLLERIDVLEARLRHFESTY